MSEHPAHVFHRDDSLITVEMTGRMLDFGADSPDVWEAACDSLCGDAPEPSRERHSRAFALGVGVLLGCALSSLFWLIFGVLAAVVDAIAKVMAG